MSDSASAPIRFAPAARFRAALLGLFALAAPGAEKIPQASPADIGHRRSGKSRRRATRGAFTDTRHPSARALRSMAVPQTPFIREACEL